MMENQNFFYEKYVKPHVKGLFNYAYKMTGDYFFSEDLVQETVIKVLEKFDKIRKKESIKSWLFKTLKNKFLDKKKKFKRIIVVESETIDRDYNEFHRQVISFEDELIRSDLSKEINNIINQLPDIFKEVIILNEIENFKYNEISIILDIPVGTVKSRLSRARKLLEATLYRIAIREGVLKVTNINDNIV